MNIIHNRGIMIYDARRSRQTLQDSGGSDPPGDLRAAVPRGRTDRVDADGPLRGVAAGGVEALGHPQARRPGARTARGTPDPLQRPAARPQAPHRLDEPLRRLLARSLRSSRRLADQDGSMNEHATATRSIDL